MTKSPSLRLLHISKFFPPYPGGIEYFLRDLAVAQAEYGHDVLVLALDEKKTVGVEELRPNLKVKRSKVLIRAGKRYAPIAPGILGSIWDAIRKFKPDIIHLHCPNPAGIFLLALGRSVPLVIHWHGDVVFPEENSPAPWQVFIWSIYEKLLLNRAAAIVATSPEYAQTSKTLCNHINKCHTIPLGLPLNAPAISPNSRPAEWLAQKPRGNRVLAVGRLAHFKGFSVLLKALYQLPEAVLCIIGSGEEAESLQILCNQLGISQRVFLAGTASPEERESALLESDIMCLPSITRAESFGLVLLEAMRQGKPCIATDVDGSGMKFVVQHEKSGLLVKPNCSQSLACAIKKLMEEEFLRKHFGLEGQKRFHKEFSILKVREQLDHLYFKICS